MGKGSGNCDDRPSLAITSLDTPTPKQEEVLRAMTRSIERFTSDEGFMDVSVDAFTKGDMGLEAVNARLTGLRKKGWVESEKRGSNTWLTWRLTPAAKEAIPFFSDD